jgi:hypothetical protein
MTPAYGASENYFSIWTVEPAQIGSEVLVLKENDFVQRARLLPIGLVELEEDGIVGPNGVALFHKGEQLFELTGGNVFRPRPMAKAVFCQIGTKSVTGIGLLGKHENRYRTCLIDEQRDGVFDSVVVAGSCFVDFPITQVQLKPKYVRATSAIRYRVVPPASIRNGPGIGIVYSGIAPLDGDPRFVVSFASGAPVPLFGQKHSRAGDAPGQRVSFGGAFTVLSKQQGSIILRNDRPIPAQPFAMVAGGGACTG